MSPLCNSIPFLSTLQSVCASMNVQIALVLALSVNFLPTSATITSRKIGDNEIKFSKRYAESVPKCRWLYDPGNCTIYCESARQHELNPLIEALKIERQFCLPPNLSIILLNTIFESSIIKFDATQTEGSRYDTRNLTVMYSYPTDLNLTENAFAGSAFENITRLSFRNVRIIEIGYSAFANLYRLEHLTFTDSLVQSFSSLNNIANTLTCFEYAELYNQSRNIHDITGGDTNLYKLTEITIHANLSSTLNASTFIALTTVSWLILADCQIEYIGPNAFDPIVQTIAFIDLTHNKLKRFSSELLQPFVDNFSMVVFEFDDNPWHCDCDLIPFGRSVKDRPHMFSGDLQCSTPNRFENSNLTSTVYCYDEDAERIENQKPSNREMISMECTDYDTSDFEVVQMRESSKIKEVMTRSNGDVVIELDVVGAHNFVIIWFETVLYSDEPDLLHYQASDTIDCLGSESSIFLISNLTANRVYTICLVNKDETTISPFDCMPYFVRSDEVSDSDANIWIFEEDKAFVIGLVIGAALLSVVFGLVIAFLLIIWPRRGNKPVERMNRTKNHAMVQQWGKTKSAPNKESGADQILKRRISNMSIRSGKSYVLTPVIPIGRSFDHRMKQIETERKYYLPDILPLPPFPASKMPRNYNVTSSSTNDNNMENYYCAINDRKL